MRTINVELETRQAELYRQFRDEFAAIVVKRGIPHMDEAEEILKRLLRLVQVASNPRLVDHAYHGVPGKLPPLRNLVEEVIDRDEKLMGAALLERSIFLDFLKIGWCFVYVDR